MSPFVKNELIELAVALPMWGFALWGFHSGRMPTKTTVIEFDDNPAGFILTGGFYILLGSIPLVMAIGGALKKAGVL